MVEEKQKKEVVFFSFLFFADRKETLGSKKA